MNDLAKLKVHANIQFYIRSDVLTSLLSFVTEVPMGSIKWSSHTSGQSKARLKAVKQVYNKAETNWGQITDNCTIHTITAMSDAEMAYETKMWQRGIQLIAFWDFY